MSGGESREEGSGEGEEKERGSTRSGRFYQGAEEVSLAMTARPNKEQVLLLRENRQHFSEFVQDRMEWVRDLNLEPSQFLDQAFFYLNFAKDCIGNAINIGYNEKEYEGDGIEKE